MSACWTGETEAVRTVLMRRQLVLIDDGRVLTQATLHKPQIRSDRVKLLTYFAAGEVGTERTDRGGLPTERAENRENIPGRTAEGGSGYCSARVYDDVERK